MWPVLVTLTPVPSVVSASFFAKHVMTSIMRGMRKEPLPTVLVILGATGDLMQRRLTPAIFRLWRKDLLPKLFQVVGFSRGEHDDKEFQEVVKGMVRTYVEDVTEEEVNEFVKLFVYQQGDFTNDHGYDNIAKRLGRKDEEWQVCSNKLYYLAVPPQFYQTIFEKLDSSGLTEPCSPEEGWTRVIVEKPFGKDLETAHELDKMLGELFREEQIYRMDHYLGKETVQNILAFRFSNSFLQPAWNKDSIESMTIRFLEKGDVGERGSFYDGVGALRDVGQNHVLQMLALFTMEVPEDFSGDSIRKNRADILSTLKRLSDAEVKKYVVRGQYDGYRTTEGVEDESATETYFSIKTELQHYNWKGVPIYLEAGKAMPEDQIEMEIVFKHSTPCLCPPDSDKHYKNVLHYYVSPKEGVHISFWSKRPGPDMVIEEHSFMFDAENRVTEGDPIDAYDRLLLNAIQGDQSSFVSTEEITQEWKFVDPIVRAWKRGVAPLHIYKKGSNDLRIPIDK